MREFHGVLPSGGVASRLHPLRFPKELLPISLDGPVDDPAWPALLIEHSLREFQRAGVVRSTVVISPTKTEILRYLGSGDRYGQRLTYTLQETPRGLADAVHLACQASGASRFVMSLPDTVFEPRNVIRRVSEELDVMGADIVLGVFPTNNPRALGPVDIAADGRVRQVLDKPVQTDIQNTWGVAAWSAAFTDMLAAAINDNSTPETNFGLLVDRACREGLDVRAVYFESGAFYDLGTREGLARAWERSWPSESAGVEPESARSASPLETS